MEDLVNSIEAIMKEQILKKIDTNIRRLRYHKKSLEMDFNVKKRNRSAFRKKLDKLVYSALYPLSYASETVQYKLADITYNQVRDELATQLKQIRKVKVTSMVFKAY